MHFMNARKNMKDSPNIFTSNDLAVITYSRVLLGNDLNEYVEEVKVNEE